VEAEEVQRIARALADPRRFEILEIIAGATDKGGISCSEMMDCVALAQPTISHHTRELQLVGLIHVRSEGRFNIATVNTDTLNDFLDTVRQRLIKNPESPA
jgi:ArsR family transcriptional regulator, arsenate/arsenite/antimonite-responsive transcriptional repressor